ncbi:MULTISPECIES: 6-pyruvoyl-tetrahydropterin synthase-related protein [unclassified Massilia]|uniref:6-pyruvoyl-tetrahydropterin synthase-related protein n=1 Tax=unclassified Massilia TaxID=2609279 RepID=UPI00177E87F5|nr:MULTISPECIES: 6-pyruvoyl-tetrahydropterin synthase-related protein [unclassified Massilia]MBD8531353.1 hypothetical protein [Massilia sp. CFBP 13647]MBD8674392.1 hypothetical protein [Massilia sp. CFBP 13721]
MTVSGRARIGGVAWLLLLTVLVWLSSLLTLRLPYQNDTLVHLRWADQFLAALREGWLLPRWASASIGGLGDPTFLYYQPLFYYVTSAFSLLGLPSEYALLGGAMVPFVLLGCIVYCYLLRAYRNRTALLGATFILACPVLYFVTASVGAFPWALSLPFSVLFVAESTRNAPRPARLAVFLALVCLSHLLSGLMALLCVSLARLLFAVPNNRLAIAGHVKWAAGVLLGLGLVGFFLYPAISQLHLINTDGWVQGANFDWRRAFALPTFTFAQYGFRWFAIQGPYALVALVLSMLIVSPLAGAADTPGKVFAKRLGYVAIAALVLGSELAYPLYAVLSPLQKLQFPYRFVFIALLLANIALVIQLGEGAWRRWGWLARTLALGLIFAQCAIMAHLQWDLVKRGVKLPAQSAFMQGRFGQPEYIPAVRKPGWEAYLETNKFVGECTRLNIVCSDTVQRTHDFSARIVASAPVRVRLPVLAFPAWSVTVDGKPVALVPDDTAGLILVTLMPGEHRVSVTWSPLPAEVAGRWITGIALLALLATMALSRLRCGRTPPSAAGTNVGKRHAAQESHAVSSA